MNTRSHNRRLKRKNQKDNVTEIVKRLDIHNGDTIVDIGSGNGSITLEFSRLAGETGCVFAADIDRELLEQIRNIEMPYDNVHTLYLENDRILLNRSYDLIFMRDVFHHLPDPASLFRRLRPCLNQNGRITIIDWNETASIFVKLTGHYTPTKKIISTMNAAGYKVCISYSHLPGQSFNVFSA
ncbi:class I SAM-dependent methyltransferase [Enterocloster clostridioformis]|uniref:class I SAM-dependent methyltransferase n=2 Tax=Enterocloster clostridioformis TaxID=1531 RepID=UPI00080C512B|nr:methyltransferase domain-containing protein [Enterocloster clostridioformis]ANU47243.1 hypothetical protein A4V08_16935 [Lachnoclostridium sp. YL32]NDO31000.1 class I SAM-dependent methyltransferase [Enterocloster clostridioformis]OXE66435.1 class I SAM-dependent methyltransferase [Enterocloster clostridioformis]QQR03736.1 methyltransferase domain-containing protein [Enterocloster clostridioformis]